MTTKKAKATARGKHILRLGDCCGGGMLYVEQFPVNGTVAESFVGSDLFS
jgi:hypothetical protein